MICIYILLIMNEIRWKKPFPTRILGLMSPEEKNKIVSYEKEYKKIQEAIIQISSAMSDIPDKIVFNKNMNYYEAVKNKRKVTY